VLVLIIVAIGRWWGRRGHGMGVRWHIHTCRVVVPRMHVRRWRVVRVMHGHRRGLVRVVVWGNLLVLVVRRVWIVHLLLHERRRRCAPSLIWVGRVMRMCGRGMVLMCKMRRRWV